MTERLILLHGWLGDPADFIALRGHLPDLIALPLPGHGGLKLDEETTTDEALNDLAERIDEKADGEPYVLGGYSMGGRAAAWLTVTGRVEPQALVLMASSPGLPTQGEREDRLAADERLAFELREKGFAEFLDRWYRLPLFAELRERPEFPEILRRRLARDPKQCARALELLSVGRQPDLTQHDFKREVLYLAGDRDRKYSDLATGWQNARAALIAGAGHAVHLERPDEVAARIREMESLK